MIYVIFRCGLARLGMYIHTVFYSDREVCVKIQEWGKKEMTRVLFPREFIRLSLSV